jgi:hypothetical protein
MEFEGAVKPSAIDKDENVQVNGVSAKRVVASGFDGTNLQDLTDDAGHLQVDVVGGGTAGQQYADGDARGTATGTLSMGDDGTNIQSLKCDANGVLQIGDNGTNITVDGAVTVTNGTAASLKAEVTVAGSQTIAVTNTGTFATQAEPTVKTGYGQGKVDNADTTTARAITGAEAQASKYFYITSIILSVAAAGSYWIEDADAAQITCKYTLAANGGVSWTAGRGTPFRSTTVNKGLLVKGSAAGVVGCMITFYAAT